MTRPSWSLLNWLWECHERNPINAYPVSDADEGWLVSHPASRAAREVEQQAIEVLRMHGLVRGRTELTLTRLGLELGSALRRGERPSPEARAVLLQLRNTMQETEE